MAKSEKISVWSLLPDPASHAGNPLCYMSYEVRDKECNMCLMEDWHSGKCECTKICHYCIISVTDKKKPLESTYYAQLWSIKDVQIYSSPSMDDVFSSLPYASFGVYNNQDVQTADQTTFMKYIERSIAKGAVYFSDFDGNSDAYYKAFIHLLTLPLSAESEQKKCVHMGKK